MCAAAQRKNFSVWRRCCDARIRAAAERSAEEERGRLTSLWRLGRAETARLDQLSMLWSPSHDRSERILRDQILPENAHRPMLGGEECAQPTALQRKGFIVLSPRGNRRDASVLPEPALGQPPKPQKVKALPTKYLSLSGSHDAHPGTGKGYRAVSRQRAIKAVA